MLRYRYLNEFDKAMNHTEERYGWLAAEPAYVSLKHEGDKVVVYERAGLLFVFNFHPTNSFSDYRVGVEAPGKYSVILSSDEKRFGGFDNVRPGGEYLTTPMEWNGRKNWLQVCVCCVMGLCMMLIAWGRGAGIHPVADVHRAREVDRRRGRGRARPGYEEMKTGSVDCRAAKFL